MPIDPVKIPQNVYVEDRIIGPVTLRQIMIILAGSGMSYAIWAAMKSAGSVSPIQSGIAWIPAIIAVLFAFVNINGISLFRIVLLLIERVNKPAKRTWQPRRGIYINIVTKAPRKSNTESIKKEEQRKNTAIEELSRLLDQGPTKSAFDSLQEEPEKENTKPVNPERISANTSEDAFIDDIKPQKKTAPPSHGGMLRDIIPPQSHA